MTDHLGFLYPKSALAGRTLVPRYYNVEINRHLRTLAPTHNLVTLGSLIDQGQVSVSSGHEIGKMAYGTGFIPFVRTSDLSNWEIKFDPKQGVSEEIYDRFAEKQNASEGDILFVRDGTYLVGSVCMLTATDSRLVFQSHLLKIRVEPNASISNWLLLALLSTPIVKRQIRAKQFTADIIDSIGDRYRELVLPIPKDQTTCELLTQEIKEVVTQRSLLRHQLSIIPYRVQGLVSNASTCLPDSDLSEFDINGSIGFLNPKSAIMSSVYVPRYYDPTTVQQLSDLRASHHLISLSQMVEEGALTFNTGFEPGKMSYGTGSVPFIRTSDIANWELKSDPKQRVNQDLFEEKKEKQDVRPEDIFVVRDGTYLVGTSCIVTQYDPPILFAGGLYKLRVMDPQYLDPYLLLALLNTPIVRRQMRSKQFTRDIIDTLGRRLFEVFVPIPKDNKTRVEIAFAMRDKIETRAMLRNRAARIPVEIEELNY